MPRGDTSRRHISAQLPTDANAELPKPRVSVFERLGPMPPLDAQQGSINTFRHQSKENNPPKHRHQRKDGKPNLANQRAETTPVRQPFQPSSNEPSTKQKDFSHIRKQVKVTLCPNALLHRSLQEVRKEAVLADPREEMKARLERAESERQAAEDLSNALLVSQQALLQDKTKLQAENARLMRDLAALQERLEYLTYTAGGDSPEKAGLDGDLSYAEDKYDVEEETAITPDSTMLRALQAGDLCTTAVDASLPSFTERLVQQGCEN